MSNPVLVDYTRGFGGDNYWFDLDGKEVSVHCGWGLLRPPQVDVRIGYVPLVVHDGIGLYSPCAVYQALADGWLIPRA